MDSVGAFNRDTDKPAADAAVRAITGFAFEANDLRKPAWTPVTGTDAAETLVGGGSRRDLFLSSAGDDRMEGGGGADVYAYAKGAGHDTIAEGYSGSDVDRLVLGADLTSTGVVVTRDGNSNHAKLSFAGASGSLTLIDSFYGGNWGVDQVRFGDGVVCTKAELLNACIA